MALRNQPYFPLYVQDYLTDEKLNNCSASTQGIYIKILCVLHKQETYGAILFKQSTKQNVSNINYFASRLSKQLTFELSEIENALEELVDENVLIIDDEKLYQKRMVKDNHISEVRSKAGKLGGGNPTLNGDLSKQKPKQPPKQKHESEYTNEFEIKFEIFRNNYPGTKKTLETEFSNFKKKHKDWKQVLETLSESLDNQIEAKRIKKAKGEFVPQWKMLSTYINNRAWEEVMPVDDEQLVVNSHSILRPTWESYYTTKTGASYFFDDKSLVALAEIEAKVKHSVAEGKNPAIPIEQAFEFILKNIKDNWVLSNLSLSVVNKKYNEIISNIKNNGKPGQQSLEQRYDDIKSIIGTMYSPK